MLNTYFSHFVCDMQFALVQSCDFHNTCCVSLCHAKVKMCQILSKRKQKGAYVLVRQLVDVREGQSKRCDCIETCTLCPRNGPLCSKHLGSSVDGHKNIYT